MLSRPESRLRMAEIIGSKLNISKEKVTFNTDILGFVWFIIKKTVCLIQKDETCMFIYFLYINPCCNLDSWPLFVSRPSTSVRCISPASCWESWRWRWAEWHWVESRLKRCSWVCKWDILPILPLWPLFTPYMHQLVAVPIFTYW